MGFGNSEPFYGYFTYHFFHVNWVHLLLNSLALITLYRMINQVLPWWKIMLFSYLYSTLAAPLASQPISTIGSSGMISSMIGLFYALILRGDLTINNKKQFIIFTSSTFIWLAVSLISPISNGLLHLLSIVFSLTYAIKNTGSPRHS